MKRIKNLFYQHFFNSELPFEYRVISYFGIITIVFSVVSVIGNLYIGLSLYTCIPQVVSTALSLVYFFSSYALRLKMMKPLTFIIGCVYLPALFFLSGGINGTGLLFGMLGILIFSLVFTQKTRIIVLLIYGLIFVAFLTLQRIFPDICMDYPDEFTRFLDFIISVILCIAAIAMITASVVRSYHVEHAKTKKLLEKVEQQNAELEILSITDPLTNVYNRRYLDQFLDLEISSYKETGRGLCVMMMDLDEFKKINDSFGHGFGDEVLINFSKCAVSSLRDYDIMARYGGEEFVAVLTLCTPQDAYLIAERIREKTSSMVFRFNAKIHVSIGIAVANDDDTSQSLTARADKNLYTAKSSGRNRTIIDGMDK